jgi:hypothetical protein
MSNPWTYSQSDKRTSRSSMNEGRGENSMLAINKFQNKFPKTSFPKQSQVPQQEAFPKLSKKYFQNKKKEIPSFKRVESP